MKATGVWHPARETRHSYVARARKMKTRCDAVSGTTLTGWGSFSGMQRRGGGGWGCLWHLQSRVSCKKVPFKIHGWAAIDLKSNRHYNRYNFNVIVFVIVTFLGKVICNRNRYIFSTRNCNRNDYDFKSNFPNPGWVSPTSTNVNYRKRCKSVLNGSSRIRNKVWEIHGPHKKGTVQSTCSFGRLTNAVASTFIN